MSCSSSWIPKSIFMILVASLAFARGATDMLTTANTTKPGCQRQCGNLTVPYPFGIGIDNGCSFNEWYVVRCSALYNPPKPFLATTESEILEITESYIKLKNKVVQSCKSAAVELQTIQESSPFTFSSTMNSFFTIGCDSLGLLQSIQGTNITVSCPSVCSRKEDVVGGSCPGIGCCRNPIPKGLKGYSIGVQTGGFNSIDVSSFSPCSYAFLAENEKFAFQGVSDFSDPAFVSRTSENVSVALEWNVGSGTTCNQAKEGPSLSYVCQENTNCSDVNLGSIGYRCSCLQGYEGNPYLSPGCKDVDECAAGSSNPCIHKETCKNTIGDYECKCPKDNRGDGRLNGTGCASKNSQLEMKIGLGVSVGLLFVFVCISWIYFTIRKRRLMKMREKFFEQNGGLLLKQQVGSDNDSTKIFSSKELKLATNNYSKENILGEGGYGTVYKGVLADDRVVAIKKSKVSDQSQIEQFINEVVILTQINHRNVVKLLGICLESQVPLLVYEYVSNGTLMGHIRDNGSGPSWLTWENCVRIASETADALSYLHSAASKPVFHRDIKSANILIDESYIAKIADFGASRLVPLDQTRVATLVQGTMGYLDPEYFLTGELSEKSDVYSFGVLLAELMTREKPVCMLRELDERSLASYFLFAMRDNRVMDIVHDDLKREANEEDLLCMARLISSCLSMEGVDRPSMKEVAIELEGLKKQIKSPLPGKNSHDHGDSSSFMTMPQDEDLYPIPSSTNESIQREMLMKVNNPR